MRGYLRTGLSAVVALFFLALPVLALGDPPAIPPVDAPALGKEIADKLTAVDEFRFIRAKAEALGLRPLRELGSAPA
jgi:hypothetical protein